ncbi:MAG: hypothetical protein ACC628_13515 [Pirellulaceae bacterium]
MLIGVDLDNTIVCYDTLFHRLAGERISLPPEIAVSKQAVRDYLRRQDQESLWTELQGVAYGARMNEATPFPGVLEFFARCRRQAVDVCVISHRTRLPFLGEAVSLHDAARHWLRQHEISAAADGDREPNPVFLETTREEKMRRIGQAGCDRFIDDLPELLRDAEFPPRVQRILFDPGRQNANDAHYHRAESWNEIAELLL